MIGYVVGVNLLSFLLFGFDKKLSKLGKYRVSEKLFFLLAFLGGFLGILIGMPIFSHKTRKRSFQIPIFLALVLYVGLGLFYVFG